MTDQCLPAQPGPRPNYVKFLEVDRRRLFPPTAAPPRSPLARRPATGHRHIARHAGARSAPKATRRSALPPSATCHRATSLTTWPHRRPVKKMCATTPEALLSKTSFYCFNKVPKPAHLLLSAYPMPLHPARYLAIQCDIEGVGVDPENPPLLWGSVDGYAGPRARSIRRYRRLESRRCVVLHVPRVIRVRHRSSSAPAGCGRACSSPRSISHLQRLPDDQGP